MATLSEFSATPHSHSASSTAPPGQAPSLLQQSTASGKANPSASSFHINRQMASHSHAGIPQFSQGLQDQAFSFQGQTQNNTCTHSARPFFPLEPLPQFPLSLGAPALGQHSALNQKQHPQAPVAMGLPGVTQHNTTDGTFYSRAGSATLPAMRPLLYGSQSASSTPSMATDIATMAKVIPNVPLKIQQRFIQGEFIDLSELFQADFQFKYASIDSNDAFKLVHKDKTVLYGLERRASRLTA